MYRDRGGGGGSSKAEIGGGPLDRKRINDALDKHLEKSSPSISRNIKDRERVSVPSTSAGKSQQQVDRRDTALPSKNKCSDGWFYFHILIISHFWKLNCRIVVSKSLCGQVMHLC